MTVEITDCHLLLHLNVFVVAGIMRKHGQVQLQIVLVVCDFHKACFGYRPTDSGKRRLRLQS